MSHRVRSDIHSPLQCFLFEHPTLIPLSLVSRRAYAEWATNLRCARQQQSPTAPPLLPPPLLRSVCIAFFDNLFDLASSCRRCCGCKSALAAACHSAGNKRWPPVPGGGVGNIKRGGVALTSSTNVSLGTSELLAKQRFELWSHFPKLHERVRKWKVAKG